MQGMLLDDDEHSFTSAPAPVPPPRSPHICRCVRSDNLSKHNLQGAIYIRDADLIIEEMIPLNPNNSDTIETVRATSAILYAFAWRFAPIQHVLLCCSIELQSGTSC